MKKLKIATLVLATSFCFGACDVQNTDNSPTEENVQKTSEIITTTVTEPTSETESISETEVASETETASETEATSETELISETIAETEMQTVVHSDLYIENLTVEQVIEYFNEVVLNTEYYTGDGDFKLVQKWMSPICYQVNGEATQTDLEQLTKLFDQLNQIEGFPGIHAAKEDEMPNLTLSFYDYDSFYEEFGEFVNYEAVDGAVQYWYYNDTNDIYDTRIGYRTDIEQYTRNTVVLEEVVNGLGITDTILREDSITYQDFNQVQDLSEIDWLLIKLLYHPEIACGMNQEECSAVIRKLYY